MRSLIGFKLLLSRSSYHLPVSRLSRSGSHQFSGISNSSRSKTRRLLKREAETGCMSLLNEIKDIFGAETPDPDQNASFSCNLKVTRATVTDTGAELDSCTRVVREKAGEELSCQFDGTKLDNLVEHEISQIVSQITKIVRDENPVVPMEERLEGGGFRLAPEIVEKVLKRCFKAPHLAIKFFNWVKRKDGFLHTSATYNTMLYIAGEGRQFELVEELMRKMEENSCEKDVKTWTILVSKYGESRMIGKALLVFEEMRKQGYEPDTAAYKTMIRSLCLSGKGDVALEFYREMAGKGMFLGLNMYKMLLNCIARTEDISSLCSIADDMARVCNITEQDVCACLLKSLCISGRIREALELIRDMKGKQVSVDPKHFEILVKGLCKSCRIADALEIFDIMKAKNLATANVYGIIISGYLKQKETCRALDLFQSMRASGILPGVSTYTELMLHLFKLNKYKKGCEIFHEMIKDGIELDATAVMAMVAGHIHHNHISEAWELFDSMEDKGIKPTWKCYSILVKEFCRVSRTEEILKVLSQMQVSGVTIGDRMFHWVVSCMERKGETAKIKKVKLLEKRHKTYSHEDTVLAIDPSIEEKSSFEFKNKPLVKMRQVKAHDEQAVQDIWALLSSPRDWGAIEETLEKSAFHLTPELILEILGRCMVNGSVGLRFFSWALKRDVSLHTTEVYNAAIKIAGCGKDFKHMRRLYYEMQRRGCLVTADTWTIMIMQYGRAGLTEIALRVFKEMKASGFVPNGATYKCLITALCGRKGKKVDEAIKIFKEMIHAGFVPDKKLSEDYICCLCGSGNLLVAKICVDSLRKVGFSLPLAYSLYIRALCQVGRVEEAFRVLDEVETQRSSLDQYTYGSIIHGLLKKGKEEEALAKVTSMKQLGIKPTVHVYTSLMVHFFSENQTEKVSEIFHKMQQEGCEPSVVTYTAMICGYMSLGETEKAWTVFHTMKDKGPSPDFITYTKFINFLCEAGKSEDALNLLSEMADKGITPSTINFRTVFFGLNREGKRELARVVLKKKSALLRSRKLSLST